MANYGPQYPDYSEENRKQYMAEAEEAANLDDELKKKGEEQVKKTIGGGITGFREHILNKFQNYGQVNGTAGGRRM